MAKAKKTQPQRRKAGASKAASKPAPANVIADLTRTFDRHADKLTSGAPMASSEDDDDDDDA